MTKDDFVYILIFKDSIFIFVIDLYWEYTVAKRWTDKEDRVLVEHYGSTRFTDLVSMLPDRSKSAIENRIVHLQKNGQIPETRPWTEEEIDFLCDNYQPALDKSLTMSLAKHLGRPQWAVNRKFDQINEEFIKTSSSWSDIEDQFLVSANKNKTLTEVSLFLNRDEHAVMLRKKALGLEDKEVEKRRKLKSCRVCDKKFFTSGRGIPPCRFEPKSGRPSTQEIRYLYLDERKTEKAIAKLYSVSTKTVNGWLKNAGIISKDVRPLKPPTKKRSPRKKSKPKNKETVIKSGKRSDLNDVFFRSGWEANLARAFNYEGYDWEFEPKAFFFKNIKRGKVTYIPDFYLPYHPVTDGPAWVEVKGRMYPGDYGKLLHFKQQYPDEFKILRGVVRENSKAHKSFQRLGIPILCTYDELVAEYGPLIPEWEGYE